MNIRQQIHNMSISPEQKDLVLLARSILRSHGRQDLQIPVKETYNYPDVEDLTLAYVYRTMKLLCGVEI